MLRNLFTLRQQSFLLVLTGLLLISSHLNGQDKEVEIYPPHWWFGMEMDTVEIMVHGKEVGLQDVTIKSKLVEVIKVEKVTSPNYVFITLKVPVKGETEELEIVSKGKTLGYFTVYEETQRASLAFKGVDPNDVMYLLMPDRFSNGDKSNDKVKDYLETGVDRHAINTRHGGDLRGINNHLDYFNELGITALWLNPFFENNQKAVSYHGYAITNHYVVDKRLGNHDDFRKLVDNCHKNDIKMVMDVVYNHIGNKHFLAEDPPSEKWFNTYDSFRRTSYRAATLMDPYVAKEDLELFSNGAFDNTMPDLNQTDSKVSKYLIQYTLWWVMEYGLNGIRIDTYAYSDQKFMKQLVDVVNTEFRRRDTSFHIFAETWVHGHGIQNYFANSNGAPDHLYLTDFQLYFALKKALSTPFGWTDGLSALYYTLAKDYQYTQPEKHVTFIDNHDLDRFYGVIKEDDEVWKIGIGLLMTLRGIPCVFYGTELKMPEGGEHGKLRKDFPGGWPRDVHNAFKQKDRTSTEQESFAYIQALAQLRKTPVFKGDFTQYIPENGVYVYFWKVKNQTLMCVVNQQSDGQSLDLRRFTSFVKTNSHIASALPNQQELKPGINIIQPKTFQAYWVD